MGTRTWACLCVDYLMLLDFRGGKQLGLQLLRRSALLVWFVVLVPTRVDAQANMEEQVEVLDTKVMEMYRDGSYRQAISLAQRALGLREKSLGPSHPQIATSLNNLASLHDSAGEYTEAELLYQRALLIREKTLGVDHPATATVLNNLADLYRETRLFDKAEELNGRALAIREKQLGPNHPDTASSLNNLALLHMDMGAYARAEPLLKRALEIYEEILGPNHQNTATAIGNLAGFYLDAGRYAEAEPLYQRALAIDESIFGSDHLSTATSLNNLAVLYGSVGDYARAELLCERVLVIHEKKLGPDHPSTAVALSNLASSYRSRGAYVRAETLFKRALTVREKIFGPEHPDVAESLNSLARLYSATGSFRDAVQYYERALAIREKVLGPNHVETADSLHGLALVHIDTRAYVDAEALLKRALKIYEERLGLNHPGVAASAAGLALLHSYTGAHTHAESLHNRVLEIVETALGSDHPTTAASLNNIAGLHSERGDNARAIPFYERALTIREKMLGPEHPDTAASLINLGLSYRDIGDYAKAESLLQRAQAITESNLLLFLNSGSEVRQGAYLQQLRPDAYAYTAIALAARSTRGIALGLNGVLQFKGRVLDARSSSIARLRYSVAPRDRELFDRMTAIAQELSILAFRPPEYLARRFEISYLTSGRDLLVIDGYSPPRSGDVVLGNPDYEHADSVANVPAANENSTRSRDLDSSGTVWGALQGTRTEAEKLRALLKLNATQVLTGGRATEGQLRALHAPRILHLATHGFFLRDIDEMTRVPNPALNFSPDRLPTPFGENPLLRSGLVLAGANQRRSGPNDDGILTSAEVAQLDLVGTQLVVLSACETALGTLKAGDGVYGLRRALVLAGAQSQLVSLWKVSDAATQELMVDYYQRLLKGAGRAGALRAVQKAMLADPARQHPYYWAAFIPIGNWSPLRD